MKKEISSTTLIGAIAGLVVILGLAVFVLFRDKPPEKHPSMKPNDKILAMPATGAPPQWFLDKMHQNSGK